MRNYIVTAALLIMSATSFSQYLNDILSGKADLGDTGIRIIGLLWLLAALAFVFTGIAVILQLSIWYVFTMIISIYSFILCIIGWPDSRNGVFINLVIIIFLIVGSRLEWFI